MVCANHQSFLDPIIIGCTCDRPLSYMARATLFRLPGLGWMMGLYNAFPVERDGIGIGGLREMLRRLKHGDMVVIFPEGTRSIDGELGALNPGFCAVARRARQPIVPLALDGAFDAWPRNAAWPRPRPIAAHVGEPLSAESISEMSDEQLIAEVHRRISLCHAAARADRLAATTSTLAAGSATRR